MERIVVIHPDQQITDEDLTNIGRFGRTSLDHVVKDGIEPGMRFTGFAVAQPTVSSITVGPGRLYKAGAVFYNEDVGGVVFDLTAYLPVNVGNRTLVTLLAWAQESDTAIEPREYLVNAETDETEAISTATESRRRANLGVSASVEGVNPPVPLPGADQLAVATVTLTTAGILSVEYIEANRLVSASGVNDRTKTLESWRTAAGARLDTLASDLANIAARLTFIPSPTIMEQIYRDLSQLKELNELPDTYAVYGFDHFLTDDESDTAHSNWLARVEEGVRFPPAAERVEPITLFNPIDPNAKTQDNMLLPAWTHLKRMEVWGRDAEISLSEIAQQIITIVQRQISRTRIRVGPPFTVCTNSAFWLSGRYDPVAHIFTHSGGDTFNVISIAARPDENGWQPVRLQQRWVDTIVENYTDRLTTTEGLTGSVRSQTFLNTNPGWLTQIGLALTRVGPAGNLNILITETQTNGAPDFNRVISRTTRDQENLRVYPVETLCPITPTFLEAGKRYAIVLVTQGNHWAAVVENNKYAQGSLFQSTDGAWQQGSLVQDLAFRLYFARFAAARVEIEMEALTLENGIAALDILAQQIVPPGTQLVWEYQRSGIWYPTDYADPLVPHPFVGLPPLLRFRGVFLGTQDLMPGLGLVKSEVTTWRPRTDFQHISDVRTVGGTATSIVVKVTVDAFDAAHHTLTCRIMHGASYATLKTPNATATAVDPDNPLRRIVTYTFTGMSVTTYKIRIDGTTDSAVNTFHVEQRFDYAAL